MVDAGGAGAGVAVRPLAVRDRDPWRALFQAYIAYYGADVSDAVIEATWQRLVDPTVEDMGGLVAVRAGGELIGLAHVVLHPSTWSATGYCYLEDLYVTETARRLGAGRALIAAVYELADARGASRTYWATRSDNATARVLYDQMGVVSPFIQYRR